MTAEVFAEDLKETLGTAMNISPDTVLADIPEWDSLSIMSVVTLLASKHGKMLSFSDVKEATTVREIAEKAERQS